MSVSKCVETYPVTRVYAANPRVVPVDPYSFAIESSGPPVVVVTFRGANSYVCRAGADDTGAWFQGCDLA